jgi:hypothetical protein
LSNPATSHAGGALRRAAIGLASLIASPVLFRLSTGRWPDDTERRQFAAAFRDRGMHIPPLARALIVTPAAREQISRMVYFQLIAEGKLPAPSVGGIPPLSGNAFAVWQGPAVSFLHVERTGGTSLAASLTAGFHPLQIWAAHRVEDLEQPKANPDDRKLVWGHYDLPTLLRLDPARRIVTVLREPAARILSLYYFWRSIHPAQLAVMADSRVAEAHRLPLLDFLHSAHQPIRDSIDNVYVRRLTGLYAAGTMHDQLRQDPDAALAQARTALAKFAYVGVSETMSETIRGIERVLGVTLGAVHRLNETVANPDRNPLHFRAVTREAMTPEISTALADLTRLDGVLYAEVRKNVLF